MIKWLGIKDKYGDKMMISMANIDKIYCHNLNVEDDEWEYFLIFKFLHHKGEIKITYGCKVRRDYAYHKIGEFINQQDKFFYDIPTNH